MAPTSSSVLSLSNGRNGAPGAGAMHIAPDTGPLNGGWAVGLVALAVASGDWILTMSRKVQVAKK